MRQTHLTKWGVDTMQCDTCKYNIFAILKDGSPLSYCERKNQRQNNCQFYIKQERSR